MNIITYEVNSVSIGQRSEDGYLNLTKMAKANGKLIADYLRLESTKEFLNELSVDMGIPISSLVEVVKGGSRLEQGTWAHPEVAIDCAQWCSAKFRVMVNRWVRDWMSQGKTPEVSPDFNSEVPSAPPDPREVEIRHLERMVEIGDRLGLGEFERRLLKEQWLKLLTGGSASGQARLLPESASLGITVSERSRALGYRLTENQLIQAGIVAGRYYKQRYGIAPEKRYRDGEEKGFWVNVYRSPQDLAILDAAIQSVCVAVG